MFVNLVLSQLLIAWLAEEQLPEVSLHLIERVWNILKQMFVPHEAVLAELWIV